MSSRRVMTGSVVRNTFKHEDLLPAFFNALFYVDESAADQLCLAYPDIFGDEPDYHDQESVGEAYERLFDVLNDSAPEGYRFGTHVDDPDDFGFWCNE